MGMWSETFLPWRHHRTTAEGFTGRSVEMWRSQTLLLRVMCCLFLFLCYIQPSPHVNVLLGCLFHEPIIFTQSSFAFKFNIFRKPRSFWRFAQVHSAPWRKLTMKSHSTSSGCVGIIFCLEVFLKGERNAAPSAQHQLCSLFSSLVNVYPLVCSTTAYFRTVNKGLVFNSVNLTVYSAGNIPLICGSAC